MKSHGFLPVVTLWEGRKGLADLPLICRCTFLIRPRISEPGIQELSLVESTRKFLVLHVQEVSGLFYCLLWFYGAGEA